MDNQIITGFNEKISERRSGLINGGIYFMKKEMLDFIPKQQKCSLENEIIPKMLENGKRLGAIVNNGYFIDIGIPEDYYRFIQDVKDKEIKF